MKFVPFLQEKTFRQKPILQEVYQTSLVLLFLVPFSVIIYKLYIPHINSFGCFDECMNYLGGYFLLHNKSLYSQIFFNHQPFMAYVSFFVLKLFHSVNLFIILLRYKQVLLVFGLIADFFIIRRFKWAGIGFVVIFELTKYYLFGDKFLAESFIAYPLVYMTGLVFYKCNSKKIFSVEYLLTSIFVWVIIFSREPFALVALVFLGVILGFPKTRIKQVAYVLFGVLTSSTLLLFPLKEYFFQVFTINVQGVGSADVQANHLFGTGFFQVFLYPFFLFFGGYVNELRIIEVGIAIVFCLSTFYFLFRKQQKTFLAVFLLLLGLANLRPIPPGQLFYSSFHFTAWWGMFLLGTLLLLMQILRSHRILFSIGLVIIMGSFTSYLVLSKSFIHYRVNTQTEFAINFGDTYALGNVVRLLSTPHQTFFIDRMDNVDLAYLESQRISPYVYADYGFVAPNYPRFERAYIHMFETNPPDFYYGEELSPKLSSSYQVVLKDEKKSKLYIKKTVYNTISQSMWDSVKQFGYTKE